MKNSSYLLFLFVVLLSFPQMSETLITPALPDISRSLEVASQLLEFSVSIFFAGFALGVSFWGIGADWWGRLNAMRCGLLIFIIGSAACALAQSLQQLYIATFIQAFGASCGSVVTQTMLRDLYTDKAERSKVFATIGMSLAFSPALGPLLGNQLCLWFGWRADYAFLALLGIALLFWCWCSLKETRPANLQVRSASSLLALAKVMVRDPFILACTVLVGVCNAIVFCFFAEGPYIFISHLQLSPEQYGWVGIVVSLSIFFAGMLNRRYISKVGAERLISDGALLMAAGSVLYLLASSIVSSHHGTGLVYAVILIAPLFVVFLGMGMMVSNLLSVALKDYQSVAGSAGSLFGFGYYVVLSSLMAGMSLMHGYSIIPLPCYFIILSVTAYGIANWMQKKAAIMRLASDG